MALTLEDKKFYYEMIDFLWQGSIGDNAIENINDKVAADMEIVLTQIKNCTEQYIELIRKLVGAMFDGIYTILPPLNWRDAVKGIIQEELIKRWINFLVGERQLKACVVVTLNNWKTKIALDLLDL